jgi:hypothetical protein
MLHMNTVVAFASVAGLICLPVSADDLPRVVGGMRHVMITVENGVLHAHVETGSLATEMYAFPEDTYGGAAGVLNGSYYSSQYGWLAGGFIALGDGESIVIENTAMDEGLRVYEGGMRMMRETHTYAPIFGTDGSSAESLWSGTMRHDWFAASELGAYEASFRLFVQDESGRQVASYGDASVTLFFSAVPSPGAGVVLVAGGWAAGGRRRNGGAS